MRQYTADVLHKQLEQVRGNPIHEAACLNGIKLYENIFKSEELVEQVRADARAGRWSPAARGAFILLRRHPHVFAAHAGRKMRRAAGITEEAHHA